MVQTCPAAMGYSFAAGTTDGPGAFDFEQGDDKVIITLIGSYYSMNDSIYGLSPSFFTSMMLIYQGNPFWRIIRNFLKTPKKEQVDCQRPKPILLDTGEMTKPYDWAVSSNYMRIINCP